MKVLMVNKFLYPNGGSETYVFKLGEYLGTQGHQVEYFGMEHEGRCVGNHVNAYTSGMDFHKGKKFLKLAYTLKTIYSSEARHKIRLVLDDFKPDVVHLNNINYQLTPSIILEIIKYKKQSGNSVKIVFTAHDYQLICPNHMLNKPQTHENCEMCLGGKFVNCIKNKCIHGSTIRSAIGAIEAYLWNVTGVYKAIDTMICCSEFMKNKLDSNLIFSKRTVALHNFIDEVEWETCEKDNFVLYFGRLSQEKGIKTLINVCKTLPNIKFVFAGSGPLKDEVITIPNIKYVGFKTGKELEMVIRKARFSVHPSEWYENCPFTVMESQMYGTPVLCADIGGIPELIEPEKTGELFESANAEDLKAKLQEMWESEEKIVYYSENCKNIKFDTLTEYYEKLIKIYQ